MPVLGDVFDIQSRVKEFDPTYDLHWNPHLKKYQVLATKRALQDEGSYNGCPLFVMREYKEIVFTWDEQGTAPDQRIIGKLIETDVWRHPRGALGYLEDLERETDTAQRKREEKISEETDYVARENHSIIFEKKKSINMGKAG